MKLLHNISVFLIRKTKLFQKNKILTYFLRVVLDVCCYRNEAENEESLQSASAVGLAAPRPRASSCWNGGCRFQAQLIPWP